jgi:hypothetical protein
MGRLVASNPKGHKTTQIGSSSFPFNRSGNVGREFFCPSQHMADPHDFKLSRGDLARRLSRR